MPQKPVGYPRAVVDRLNSESNRLLKLPETATQLERDGVAPHGGTPEQFVATIRKEIEVWKAWRRRGRESRVTRPP